MAGRELYDLLIIGGGIAGAALARAVAEAGYAVLVAEKDKVFRDRIRGEVLLPWGSVEAKELGIYDLLVRSCGQELPRGYLIRNGEWRPPRELHTSTPHATCIVSFFHPEMQEVLLAAAATAGAEVLRGANLGAIVPGTVPAAEIVTPEEHRQVRARIVVGADGRESQLATLLGLERQRDPPELFTGGLQFEGDIPADRALYFYQQGRTGCGGIFAVLWRNCHKK